MVSRFSRIALPSLALAAAACANVLGLGDYGDAPSDGGTPISDSVADGAIGTFAVPSGWSLVAYATGSTTACPSGFSKSPTTLIGGAPSTDGACTCDTCTLDTPPSCVKGALTISYDADGSKSCNTPFQALANANAGGCNTDNYHGQISPGFDIKFTPPPPSGGTCSAAAPTKHAEKLTFAEQGLACSPDSDAAAGCSGGACAPSLPAPFTPCISHPGDMACPGGPLAIKHHVGTAGSFDCNGVCSCSVTATCTNGTVTYYGDGTCGGPMPLVNAANGTCVNQGGKNGAYGSYKYSATVNASCTTSGGGTPTSVTLAGEATLCCSK